MNLHCNGVPQKTRAGPCRRCQLPHSRRWACPAVAEHTQSQKVKLLSQGGPLCPKKPRSRSQECAAKPRTGRVSATGLSGTSEIICGGSGGERSGQEGIRYMMLEMCTLLFRMADDVQTYRTVSLIQHIEIETLRQSSAM